MTQHLTRHEIFYKAWEGLKSQGFVQALDLHKDNRSYCLYKTASGNRCAIGWCMSEENAAIAPMASVNDIEVQKLARISPEDVEFARSLQRIHDECDEPNKMKERLIGFAYANQMLGIISNKDL